MKKFFALFILVTFLLHLESFAWSKKGHQLVAQIAYHFLNEATKMKLKQYLGNVTVESAATWMDDVRGNSMYDYMKPWHFVNLEKDEEYDPDSKNNIVRELQRVIEELKNRDELTNAKAKTNLKILFHLIGDLHQPLHTGYGSDRGGNKIKLTFINESSDLHKVWDDNIIRYTGINKWSCINLYDAYSDDEIEQIRQIDVPSWMMESREYLGEVYNFKNKFIGTGYINKNQDVIKDQLLRAGLRLASILTEVFSEDEN